MKISQRHGFADPDPDPQQNVMDPQHCHNHLNFHMKNILKEGIANRL
jgi:hypothetical protein